MLNGKKFPLAVWLVGLFIIMGVPVFIWVSNPILHKHSLSWLTNATLILLEVCALIMFRTLIVHKERLIKPSREPYGRP